MSGALTLWSSVEGHSTDCAHKRSIKAGLYTSKQVDTHHKHLAGCEGTYWREIDLDQPWFQALVEHHIKTKQLEAITSVPDVGCGLRRAHTLCRA